MPLQPPVTDQSSYLDEGGVNDLLTKTKASLVNQYPYLANHPQFSSEIDDAFAKFNQLQLQRGTGLEDAFGKTILPTIQKWQSQAPRDVASELQKEDAMANKLRASGAASALDVPSMFPKLTDPKSPYRTAWETRMNHDVNVAGRSPKLSAQQQARKQFLQEELKRSWASDALPGMKPNTEAEKKLEAELSALESSPKKSAASMLSGPSFPSTPSAQAKESAPLDIVGTGKFAGWKPRLNSDSVIQIGGDTLRAKPAAAALESPSESGDFGELSGQPPADKGPASLLVNQAAPLDISQLAKDTTSPAAMKAAKANQIAADHPDWTRAQIILAVNGQLMGAQ